MYYPEIESRLTSLGRHADAVLSEQQRQWFDEYVDAGEYGLALEVLAESLAEDGRSISAAFRAEALVLASAMGIDGRVSNALALCPDVSLGG